MRRANHHMVRTGSLPLAPARPQHPPPAGNSPAAKKTSHRETPNPYLRYLGGGGGLPAYVAPRGFYRQIRHAGRNYCDRLPAQR